MNEVKFPFHKSTVETTAKTICAWLAASVIIVRAISSSLNVLG
jgi:hypothetical protein